MPNGPITKDKLLSALESMQSHKSKRKDAAWYVAILKEHKVDFLLTTEVEQKIRLHGNYLRKRDLDNLIAAVRDNYRQNVSQQPTSIPSSINQTMTNSPGGIQAGGNITINERPQARELTPEQRQSLIRILNKSPKGSIDVTAVMGDNESAAFADQLTKILESAGWTVVHSGLTTFVGHTVGLIVVIHDSQKVPEHADVLRRALNSIGFPTKGEVSPSRPQDVIELVVASKP